MLNVFFFFTGTLLLQLLQLAGLHIDAVTLALGLFNFSVRRL